MLSSLGSCGRAVPLRILFRKLSLSCACRKVIPNGTSLNMGRITARSTHEENATANSGAFSIGGTFFLHCIALASMQLIDTYVPL